MRKKQHKDRFDDFLFILELLLYLIPTITIIAVIIYCSLAIKNS